MNVATPSTHDVTESGPESLGDPRPDSRASGDAEASIVWNVAADGAAAPAVDGRLPDTADTRLTAWVAAIVDQDERALASFYDATFSRVFGLVRRIVREVALAEEIVEETYFQVWRQAARFDPARGTALTWLLSMARSRAIDALRHEARFDHDTLHPDSACEVADANPAPDELLDLARNRADLHQAMQMLGAQPRQMVSMSFFRGLSHSEIAEQMGVPLGTVKSQIRRALLSLREMLAKSGATLPAA